MRRDAGFTLLEVLAALVVLGFVVAGLSQGLQFGLRAAERQERASAQRGDLDAVDRLLRRIVVQMDPGTNREPSKLAGNAGRMAFATDLGAAASALGTSRAEVGLGVEDGRLVLRWRPALHAAQFAPPPEPQSTVLLDGLDRIELGYWGPSGDEPAAWHSTWQQPALPLLVRVRLVFRAGSGRRWPDIVAGPAVPRPAS